MRSVFVFLDVNDKNKIVDCLNSICFSDNNLQWNFKKEEDTVLYIQFDDKKNIIKDLEYDAEEYGTFDKNLLDKLRSYHTLIVDISGRHSGEGEVFSFLNVLLSKFRGFALDDYTEYLWTLEEIREGFKYKNHRFFDHLGWYNENSNKD